MEQDFDKLFGLIVDNIETSEKLENDQKKSEAQSMLLKQSPVEQLLQDLLWRWLGTSDGQLQLENQLSYVLMSLLRDKSNFIVENTIKQEVSNCIKGAIMDHISEDMIVNAIRNAIINKIDMETIKAHLSEQSLQPIVTSAIMEKVNSELTDSQIKYTAEEVIRSIMNKKFGNV